MTRALFRAPQEPGYEAPCFTIRPCPACGSRRQGSASGPRPSTIHCLCIACGHEWIADSDQVRAAQPPTAA